MKAILLAFFLVLNPFLSPVWAIVNLEDLHLSEPKKGLSGNTSLGISGAEGNSEYIDAEWKAKIQSTHESATRYALLQYAYGESFKEENRNSAFIHLRNIQNISVRQSWEIFAQAEQNKFARLKLRALVGGGLRWDVGSDKNIRETFLGAGGFYSHESINAELNASDAGKENLIRGNFYLVYKKKINSDTLLFSTTYYQPSVSDIKDFRLLEVAGLKVALQGSLSIVLNLELSHDNRPPQFVDKTDLNYKTELVYQFN